MNASDIPTPVRAGGITPARTTVRREQAAARLNAHRRRVSLIRKRVVAAAAATFALLWGVIFVQLVSGHDPALGQTSTNTASARTTAATQSASANSSSATETSSSTSSTPVSTGQS